MYAKMYVNAKNKMSCKHTSHTNKNKTRKSCVFPVAVLPEHPLELSNEKNQCVVGLRPPPRLILARSKLSTLIVLEVLLNCCPQEAGKGGGHNHH